MKKLVFIVGLFVALTACKHSDSETNTVKFPPPVVKPNEEVMQAKMPPPNSDANTDVNTDSTVGNSDAKVAGYDNAGNNGPSVDDTAKKIVKDGSIEFETNDLAATRQKILASLKKLGGYVDEDDQTTNTDQNRKEYELKIRIPAKNFDFFVDSVSSSAYKIDSKDISITDVTTKFIDIATRLDNKKILEKRYLELLGKSSKVSDLIEIENKLTEIRSDIESTQGQLNYLGKQVAYSSLDITFYTTQAAQVSSGNGFGYKFKTAIAHGWHSLQKLFFGLIALWPAILLVLIIYWLFKAWRKRIRSQT